MNLAVALGRRATGLACALSCVRAAAHRPGSGSIIARSLFARVAPTNPALWARLRAGDAREANLTTVASSGTGGKPTMVATLEEFDGALKEAGDKLVIVDFTATWCGPCKMIGPVFDKLAAEYGDRAVFLKVDVDENSDTAADCGIRAMPTFQFYKSGGKLAEFAGADKDKLLELLKEHI
ncbi:hypothetical protein KFE25_014021 [Diacronema lutheri]|uniref:Thioredoxin domain-containing protein n=2 Tax=Diacronema lutheri TaxID=2081491 RepID=A0A8J5XIT7_DIALT|nr:hypothetical protein KFE25_014021 [Diacronema lutheri]